MICMTSSKIQKIGRMEYFSDHAGSFSFSWCTPITVKPMANHQERERERERERESGGCGGERRWGDEIYRRKEERGR